MRRSEVSPAFLGSLALHGTVLAALLISWRFSHDLKIGTVVPVTIVANAPATDLKAAEQAPQEQTAQTEQPVAEAPPQASPPPQAAPPPPAPSPKPEPAKPVPTPTPKPAPAKPQPKPEKSLDFDALAASLSKSIKPTPPKPSSATKGPARPETALQARPAAGSGNSAAAMSGLANELQRRWNPNCEVEGGRDVVIKVGFQLGAGGNVVGDVSSQILRGPQSAVGQAAADRAVRAVYAAAPFRDLPREFYGQRITVNFNAREACS
ncbi:energy transducer TonB [Phenylobacterium soli]|nr:energy transducer TonB [Phenylobacterium soli]